MKGNVYYLSSFAISMKLSSNSVEFVCPTWTCDKSFYSKIFLNAKVSQPFNIRVFFSMVHVRIFCTMSNDLPSIGFDHAFHSDVIMTLLFYKDLRLT